MNQEQKYLVKIYAPEHTMLPTEIVYLCLELAGLIFFGKSSLSFVIYSCPIRRTIIKSRPLSKYDL